jgi:hypothetical protein
MRLPFETDYAATAPGQTRKWLRALDDLGMENVRIRLVQSGSEPTDVFYRVSSDSAVPRGFAEDWLGYRDRRSHTIEQRWRWAIFIPACISALAACTAGLVILAPHLSSALHRLRAPHQAQVLPGSATSALSTASPAPTSLNGWRPVAVDEYIVVNGSIYQAETGPQPDALQRIESPDVIRFQIVPGNRWYNDGPDAERTELDGYKQTFEVGVPYWVAYSLYIEPAPRFTSDWIALGQIPGLMGHILKSTIMSWNAAGKGHHNAVIKPGENYQFLEKIIIDPVNGYYGSWLNGKQVVDYHGRMGEAGKKYYYKIGVYRGPAPETMVVRYANFKLGTTDLSSLIDNPDAPPPVVPWP